MQIPSRVITQCVTRPVIASEIPNARIIGQIVGVGRLTNPSVSP